jgi:hypothetical protein
MFLAKLDTREARISVLAACMPPGSRSLTVGLLVDHGYLPKVTK